MSRFNLRNFKRTCFHSNENRWIFCVEFFKWELKCGFEYILLVTYEIRINWFVQIFLNTRICILYLFFFFCCLLLMCQRTHTPYFWHLHYMSVVYKTFLVSSVNSEKNTCTCEIAYNIKHQSTQSIATASYWLGSAILPRSKWLLFLYINPFFN